MSKFFRAANGWITFRRITLPLIMPAVWVGTIVALILSFNEVVMALFLSTPAIKTLPTVIWPNLRDPLTPLVAAASSITLVLTVAAMTIISGLLHLKQRKQKE